MTKKVLASDEGALLNTAALLLLIARGEASSRATLQEATGLSRVTLTHRLNTLLGTGLVSETETKLPSGGRPTKILTINQQAGVILVANLGEEHIHLAVMDLQPEILAQTTLSFSSKEQPKTTLDKIHASFIELMATIHLAERMVIGMTLCLPTPVDYNRGCVVGPSVLPLWDEFDIKVYMKRLSNAPVYVENDVNLMTICEHRRSYSHVQDMLFIKMGTGIGSGIITGGTIFRGAKGAAGDIGHIQFSMESPPLCRCGKFGCIEASAGGWALARDLTNLGYKATNARDVIEHVSNNRPEAIMLIRRAGKIIGEVTADSVSLLNPALIVVGGTLAKVGDYLLSGVRELVYQRCLPLATRELQIVLSENHDDSAMFGAAYLVLDDIFRRENIEKLLSRFIS